MADTITFALTTTDALQDAKPVAGSQPVTFNQAQPVTNTWLSSSANTLSLGADTVYGPVKLTVLNGTPQTLTFSNGGGLTSNSGNAIAMARVKGVKVWNVAAGQTTADGVVGNGAKTITLSGTMLFGSGRPIPGTTPSLPVTNGMAHALGFDNNGAGYAVTLSSTDTIIVTNNDGANTIAVVELCVWGGST